jgi:hypothetical protein
MVEREKSERKSNVINDKIDEFVKNISNIVETKVESSAVGLDILAKKIKETVDENKILKGKLAIANQNSNKYSSDNLTNKEIINCLTNDLKKIQRNLDNLKVDADKYKTVKYLVKIEFKFKKLNLCYCF